MNYLNIQQVNLVRHSPVLLLAILFYSPVSFEFMNIGGKPVDLMFSDLVCFVFFLYYIFRVVFIKVNKPDLQRFSVVIYTLLFFFFLASFGFMKTGSIVIFFTFLKYIKVFIALVAGMGLARFYTIEFFWKISVYASAAVIIFLLYSQLVISGSYYPRWGQSYLGLDVYGFPNSPASYYIILFMFIVTSWVVTRQPIYALLGLIASLFMILSLSRSAIVVFFIYSLPFFFVCTSLKKTLYALFFLCLLFLGMYFILQDSSFLQAVQDALMGRYERTVGYDDFSSGRIGIAAETLGLVYQHPLTGYLFDSFDNYHYGHSTPHNQYLEALFKTGILGFLAYFYVVLMFIRVLVKRLNFDILTLIEHKLIAGFMCVFLALSVGNFTQPNFTYSQTGNVLFLTLGFLAYAKSKKNALVTYT